MNSTKKTAEPAHMDTLREKAQKESEKEADKERFGLFGQPSPLGIGDCDYNLNHKPRDENGGVVMEPPNFYTNPMKQTKSPEVYFDNSNFMNKERHKDPYIDYTKIHRPLKAKPIPQKKDNDGVWIKPEPFLPSVTKWNQYVSLDDKKVTLGNPYKSMGDYHIKKLMKNVDANDRVITAPPNVITEPTRGGHYNSTYAHTINKFPEYKGDGYDLERHKDHDAKKKWNALYKEKDSGYFKSMSAGPYALNHDKKIYGDRPEIGPEKKVWVYKQKLVHDEAFRPSNPYRKGKLGTFDKFERLIPDPNAIPRPTRKDRDPNAKDSFFPSRGVVSKPCPSISLNYMNIRNSIR